MDTISANNPESFTTYPNGRVCAIIPLGINVGHAYDELTNTGVRSEDIEVYYGKKGAAVIDADAEHHGLLASIAKAFRGYGDEENKSMHIYEAALENGEYVFTIKVDNTDEAKEPVRKILADHSAREINYFGTWVVEAMETV